MIGRGAGAFDPKSEGCGPCRGIPEQIDRQRAGSRDRVVTLLDGARQDIPRGHSHRPTEWTQRNKSDAVGATLPTGSSRSMRRLTGRFCGYRYKRQAKKSPHCAGVVIKGGYSGSSMSHCRYKNILA